MPKAVECNDQSGKHAGWMIECPACGHGHLFDDRWTFNGNQDRPTFSPSMLCNAHMPLDLERGIHRCHSFVTDGKIQYLSDCSHSMAGQTVELPEIEE